MTEPTTLPRRWQMLAPLASASAAISEALQRRQLQRQGMVITERRLAGQLVTTYVLPGAATAPPIAMIHGLGASAMSWAQLLRRLRNQAPIMALDLPGFGLSPLAPEQQPLSFKQHAQVVCAFLEQVVGQPALLVGNSLGGWLVLHTALKRPELVAGAVALNPAGVRLEPELWQATGRFFQPAGFADVRAFYRALFGRVPAPLYLAQPETLRRLWRRSVQGFLAVTEESDMLEPAALRSITRPLTVVWGSADQLLPAASLGVLRESLPGARFIILPGCGHMPQIQRPDQTADAVRAALQQSAEMV